MKTIINKFNIFSLLLFGAICFSLLAIGNLTYAQDSTKAVKEKTKAVKYTFNGTYIIDNQTVMVPVAKTIEFSIQHRFGVWNNGYKDFFGLYAPANIRLGFNYTPINNLQLGFGFCKDRSQWDGNAKYAILRQR